MYLVKLVEQKECGGENMLTSAFQRILGLR